MSGDLKTGVNNFTLTKMYSRMNPHTMLSPDASFSDMQTYLKRICQERGWDSNTDLEMVLLLTEEVGELADALRQYESGELANRWALDEEFADVLSYLMDLANHFGVDLDEALRDTTA